MGQSPPSSTYNTTADGLPFFQGKVDFGYLHPKIRVFCNQPSRIAKPGDILISVRAPVGPTNLARERCCIGRGLAALRPRSELNTQYLLFFLRFREPNIAALGKGSTFEAINRDDLEDLEIPLPPLSEQLRIAKILDGTDRLRRTRRYTLGLSDTFLPAVFVKLFGEPGENPWSFPVCAAAELFHIELGKMLDAKRITGKYLRPYLGNANVQWGRFDLDNLKVMDFSPEDFQKFKLTPGDILVCEGGEVGRTAIWRGEVPDCCYQKALHRLRRKTNKILPGYFQYFMKSAVDAGLIRRYTATSTIAHFTAEKFEDFPVMLPPLPLQQKFISLVEGHERLQALQRENSRQAEHLFQSLLHRAFTVGF